MFLQLSKQRLISLDNDDVRDLTLCNKNHTHKSKFTSKIWKIISNGILDFWIECNEYLVSQGISSQNLEFGSFAGHTFTIFYFLVRYIQDNLLKPNKDKLKRFEDYFDLSNSLTLQRYEFYEQFASFSGIQRTLSASNWFDLYLKDINILVQVLAGFIVLSNVLITITFLVWSYKDYSLFHIKTVPKSNNIHARSLTELYGNDEHRPSFTQQLRKIYHFFTGSRVNQSAKGNDVFYQFSRWTPSPLMTALFTSFNPVVVIFLYFNDTKSKSLISLFLLQYVMKCLVMDSFVRARKEEQVFIQALVEESTSKLLTGYTGSTQSATSPSDRKIFITHSLTGEVIKEAYNYKKQEFEII